MKEYSFNWLIHGNRDTRLQSIKGSCKQLKPSKIFSRVWPIARLLCACKHSFYVLVVLGVCAGVFF